MLNFCILLFKGDVESLKRILKISIIVIGMFVALVILPGAIVGNYMYNTIINSSSDKSGILSAPHNNAKPSDNNSGHSNDLEAISWFEKNSTEDYIYSFDKLKLHSYVLMNENNTNKWVIMCHGYNGNGLKQSGSASYFYNMGFNILAPDARGHGKSEGNYIGFGWHDRLDVIEHINRIIREDKDAEIVLYGVSMGGTTVLMSSGENLPPNVKAVIEDCGFSSAWDELSYQLKQFYNLPEFPFLNCMSLITKLRAGYLLEEADALKQVSKSKVPTLFIHAAQDTFVPPYMVDELYQKASCPKEKLIVDNAGHVQSSKVAKDLYWNTIKSFLGKYKII